MRIAERDETGHVPDWAISFLRDRCGRLQRQLVTPADPIFAAAEEEDSIHCWLLLQTAAQGLPLEDRAALDDLQVLHARVAERLDRGGVADIAEDVEHLVRAILIDQLQRMTDAVVERLVG
jgi:hypothetical protein